MRGGPQNGVALFAPKATVRRPGLQLAGLYGDVGGLTLYVEQNRSAGTPKIKEGNYIKAPRLGFRVVQILSAVLGREGLSMRFEP